MIKTLRLKVKDPYTMRLNRLAVEVNDVWNYVNSLSFYMIRNYRRFLSYYDVRKYLTGATKEYFHILSGTLEDVASTYCERRKAARKTKLRWRQAGGSRRSLGWIPFRGTDLRLRKGFICYGKTRVKVFDSYDLKEFKFRAGSFNEDSRGNWWLNVCVDTEDCPSSGMGEIGIDLGLKDFAVLSTGEKVAARQAYRESEEALGKAQRARKKKRVRSINAKIKNRRKDFLQKLSTRLVAENKLIVVGDVSSARLAKTKMAKSVLDAGWSMFKAMLEYKAIRRQVVFKVVNEAWTSRTCSACKNRTGPQGLGGLGIREWTCSECGSVHDRDVNAAQNILALGRESLAVGIAQKE